MKTNLTRAAIVAATSIAKDGFDRTSPAQVAEEVKNSHMALFDAEIEDSTPEARRKLNDAVDLACDLVNFARAVRDASAAR